MSVTEPRAFQPEQEAAWFGLLSAHQELTRGLDGCLTARHGLSLSAYQVLSRLACADKQRMSELAAGSGLSLSRVSRIIDSLCGRGLTVRSSCASDSRVVHASITDAGRALVAEAQETFFTTVEQRFLNRLSCDEVRLIGDIFGRLVEAGPPSER